MKRDWERQDPEGIGVVHYLTWPTATRYACGYYAVGMRSTRRDCDPDNTTCWACLDAMARDGKARGEE